MRIFLLEDNSIDVDLTVRQLSDLIRDCSIEVASSVRQAKEIIAHNDDFDIALLDMNLPDGSGLDVLLEMKQSGINCPVIFLTGSGSVELAASVLKAGADDFVVKRENYISRLPQVIIAAISNHQTRHHQASEIIRVVYVEHHHPDIDLAVRYLSQYAPQIHLTPKHSAEEVLRLLTGQHDDELPFDVVLIDYQLPGINALEFTKIIRQEKKLSVPIIIVTGHGSEDTVIQALKLGADEYLVKRDNYIHKLPSLIQSTYKNHQLRRNQKELSESVNNYRLMFENNPQPMWIYDVETLSFLEVNHAALELYGYTADEFSRLTIKDIRPPEDVPALMDFFHLSDSPGIDRASAWKHIKKNGELIDVEIISHPVNYKGRKARHVLINDITERKKTESALIYSEEKYRTIFENVHDVFYQTDLDGIIREISPSIKYFSEFSRDELIGSQVTDMYTDIAERGQLIKTLMEKSEVRDYRITIKTKSGEIRHGSINARLISNSQGIPDHIDGAIRDITQRIKAEEKLSQSEEKFRNLFENHSAVKLIIDPETAQIVEANSAASKFYGWSVEELTSMKVFDINTLPEDNLIQVIEKIRNREEAHFEFQHRCSDGSIKDVEVFSSKIVIAGKDFLHSIIHDVTDKKKAEAHNRLLSVAVDQSPVSVVITNAEGIIEYVNPRFCRLTGYSREEVIGNNPRILNSGYHSAEFYQKLWKTISGGNEWIGELLNKKKNGELFWENASISPLINENGEISHFVGIKEDITEKRKLIEDLIAAKEKAEASDKLKTAFINNISHEVRTPLNGILGFSELLTNPELPLPSRTQFYDIIKKSSTRLLNTITSYMDISMIVSGTMEVKNQEFPVSPFLKELRDEYEYQCYEKDLQLDLQLPAGLMDAYLNTDKYLLKKILGHLLDNALKFTNKGKVEFGIQIRNSELEFYVVDSGVGIEPEKVALIFGHFAQADTSITRGHEGSGLGLSISYGLIKLLGGELSVDSKVDIGSRFSFRLSFDKISGGYKPVLSESKKVVTPVDPLILVAEDDDNSFRLMEVILQRENFRILRAMNGQEAVELCQANPQIDLVLMDMKMPVMGGMESTRKIRSLFPDIKVIALTAYVSKEDEDAALKGGCIGFIAKPVNKQRLLDLISEHLK